MNKKVVKIGEKKQNKRGMKSQKKVKLPVLADSYMIQKIQKLKKIRKKQEKIKQLEKDKKKILLKQLGNIKEKIRSQRKEIVGPTSQRHECRKNISSTEKTCKNFLQVSQGCMNLFVKITAQKILPLINKLGRTFLKFLKERTKKNDLFFSLFHEEKDSFNFYKVLLNKIKLNEHERVTKFLYKNLHIFKNYFKNDGQRISFNSNEFKRYRQFLQRVKSHPVKFKKKIHYGFHSVFREK